MGAVLASAGVWGVVLPGGVGGRREYAAGRADFGVFLNGRTVGMLISEGFSLEVLRRLSSLVGYGFGGGEDGRWRSEVESGLFVAEAVRRGLPVNAMSYADVWRALSGWAPSPSDLETELGRFVLARLVDAGNWGWCRSCRVWRESVLGLPDWPGW